MSQGVKLIIERFYNMKKVYIQPTIEFELIETSDILESSWKSDTDRFDGEDKDAIDGKVDSGDGTDVGDAKQSTFIWDDEF